MRGGSGRKGWAALAWFMSLMGEVSAGLNVNVKRHSQDAPQDPLWLCASLAPVVRTVRAASLVFALSTR